MPDELHGTRSGYCNWGCRCEPCKAAGIEANIALREDRRARGLIGPPRRWWTIEEEIEALEAEGVAELMQVAQRQRRSYDAVRWRRWKIIHEAAT